MNCEQAEDILSAYLDNHIDPPQRTEFEAHLAGCAECSATLAEYRRFDDMLRTAPRVAPAESLRASIFGSDEFAEILRSLDQDHDDAGRPTPAAGPGRRRATASWSRRGLQVAAVLALALGSALLVTQGLLHSSPSGRRSQPLTISGTGQQAPLAAGNRVVYLRDANLWSAPQNGPGIAQRLSPSGTQVAGWAVAPDGQTVAYIDAKTGEIHVIRADGQSDHVVGATAVAPQASGFWSSASGQAVRSGLAWSPNGEQIAYLAAGDEHSTTLRVMNADGTNDRAVDSTSGAMFGAPVWSADSLRVAYTLTAQGAQSVWSYNEDLQTSRRLAVQADPADANATATQIAWLPDTVHPALTWAAMDGQSVTGVFTQALLNDGAPARLTRPGVHSTTVSYRARGGGVWLVATPGSEVQAISPTTGTGAGTTLLDMISATTGNDIGTPVDGVISAVSMAPVGDMAAFVTSDGALILWSSGKPAVTITMGAHGTPVWSADGMQLAVPISEGVVTLRVSNDVAVQVARVGGASGESTLAWAPDAHTLAIGGVGGVTLVAADGSQQRVVDGQPAGGAALAWTLAR